MGAGHAHPLYLPGTSAVHRLPAEVKIVAALLGAVCVVATPREAFGVFAGHLVVLQVHVPYPELALNQVSLPFFDALDRTVQVRVEQLQD